MRVCGLALWLLPSPHDNSQPFKTNSRRQILSNTEQTLDSFYWGLGDFFLWARSFGSIWQHVCSQGLLPGIRTPGTADKCQVHLLCSQRNMKEEEVLFPRVHHSESICSGCQGQEREVGGGMLWGWRLSGWRQIKPSKMNWSFELRILWAQVGWMNCEHETYSSSPNQPTARTLTLMLMRANNTTRTTLSDSQ